MSEVIDTVEAGNALRELNAEVARKVFGFAVTWGTMEIPEGVLRIPHKVCESGGKAMLPDYSGSMNDDCAWDVVETMADRGHFMELFHDGATWSCDFDAFRDVGHDLGSRVIIGSADASSPSEAICRAALAALRHDTESE